MNTKQRTTMILVILLSLALSSCAPGQLFGPTAMPTLTSTPAATSTPASTPTEAPEEIITDAVETACQMKPVASPSVGVSTVGLAVVRLCPDVDSSITLPDKWTAKMPGDLLYVVAVQNVTEAGSKCGPYRAVINGTPTGPDDILVNTVTTLVNISLINIQTGKVVNSATVYPPAQGCPQTISSTSSIIEDPPPAQEVQDNIVNLVSNQVSFSKGKWNTLTGHTSSVNSVAFTPEVAFSPDGKLLAAGLEDNTVHLWDVASEQEVRTLTIATSSVAFSPDWKLLATETR